jgi:hypothetical protein
MRHATQLLCTFLVLSSTLRPAGAKLSSSTGDRPTFRHAYYIFLSGVPNGCEDCYVPLLITQDSLEQVAKAEMKAACVLIVTYERDSVWHNDGIVSVAPDEIEVSPRIIHLRGRKYRYQEVGSAEVVRLLDHPLGTIPISRPLLPKAEPPGPTLEDLASSFRDLK